MAGFAFQGDSSSGVARAKSQDAQCFSGWVQPSRGLSAARSLGKGLFKLDEQFVVVPERLSAGCEKILGTGGTEGVRIAQRMDCIEQCLHFLHGLEHGSDCHVEIQVGRIADKAHPEKESFVDKDKRLAHRVDFDILQERGIEGARYLARDAHCKGTKFPDVGLGLVEDAHANQCAVYCALGKFLEKGFAGVEHAFAFGEKQKFAGFGEKEGLDVSLVDGKIELVRKFFEAVAQGRGGWCGPGHGIQCSRGGGGVGSAVRPWGRGLDLKKGV